MPPPDPWVLVAGTALALIRGRGSPEGTLVSAWPLIVAAGRQLGVEFPPDLVALEALVLPRLPADAGCWALQEQALAQAAARDARRPPAPRLGSR